MREEHMRPSLKNILLLLSLSIVYTLNGALSPPQLSEQEACSKAREIFRNHARYQEFTPTIAQRTLHLFIEELDPSKTYFLEPEVAIYLNPSDKLLNRIVADYQRQKLTAFEEIYQVMITAVERRNSLEEEVSPPKGKCKVSIKQLGEAGFAKDKKVLLQRLQDIRALQKESANALDNPKERELLYQRIAKRRMNKESELIGSSKIDQKRLTYAYFLKSVSESLDCHTSYFTPAEAKLFLIQVQQRLFGIGAQLRDDINGLSVVRIIEGGPASAKNELKIGDRIISVNHETIVGMDINEAVEMIRGPKGTSVILTVIRESETKTEKLDISITRDEVVLQEGRYQAKNHPYGEGVIAHIHLHAFYQDPTSSSTEDVKRAILNAKNNHNLQGVILDLRNNAGGLLPEAISVTGLFIKNGVVASIKDNAGQVQRLRDLSNEQIWDGPLIVLINRASASASEIVALALSDYGRALIVGDDHSYGKGTYQTFTLESSNPDRINPTGEYKVTRGAYYTVGGRSPQLCGVPSNIVVPGILSKLDIGEEFNKYPLANDHIEPQFIDDLSDIHPLYRMRVRKMIGKNPQVKTESLEPMIPLLKKHSQARIAANINYQNFLKQIEEADLHEIDLEQVGENDLQFEETCNIMKELILYQEQAAS